MLSGAHWINLHIHNHEQMFTSQATGFGKLFLLVIKLEVAITSYNVVI